MQVVLDLVLSDQEILWKDEVNIYHIRESRAGSKFRNEIFLISEILVLSDHSIWYYFGLNFIIFIFLIWQYLFKFDQILFGMFKISEISVYRHPRYHYRKQKIEPCSWVLVVWHRVFHSRVDGDFPVDRLIHTPIILTPYQRGFL